MPASETKFVDLDKIRIDGGTQMRAAIDKDHVSDLANAIERGEKLPPIRVYIDGADTWLARGFHRYYAHKKSGRQRIEAEVHVGTLRDAILDAAGDNAEHNALKRTNADKRKAVTVLLKDGEWSQRSDNWIAQACKVSNKSVAIVRSQVGEIPADPFALPPDDEGQLGKSQVENGDTAPKTQKSTNGEAKPAKRIGRDGKARSLPKRKPKADANGHDNANGEHAPEAAPRTKITDVENTEDNPFAEFNAGLDELMTLARSLRTKTTQYLKFKTTDDRSPIKWAAELGKGETISHLNRFIARLEDYRPAKLDSSVRRGFMTEYEMSPREQAFRAARVGGAR